MKKLQMFYLTYFIGKSYVDDDGSQNYLIFQPVQFLSILKFLVVLLITLLQWKPEDWSKDLALDSVHVHFFNSKLLLLWLIVYQHLLITGKYILVIPKGSAHFYYNHSRSYVF